MLPFLLGGVAVLAAGHALLNKRDSKAAFGWMALCLILPLAGPIIYLLFGINRVRTRAQRNYLVKVVRDSLNTIHDPPGTRFRPLSTVGETLTRKGLSSCDSLVPLENGEGLYPAMLDAIEAAESRILLASYIFDSDRTGHRFVAALSRARRRGVHVRILLDGLGEYMRLPRIGPYLQKEGLTFARFNPLTLMPPALNINMRNHRKLLIVDGCWAFTGGQNIGNRHLVEQADNRHGVHDIHFRLSGKIVDELEWSFWQDWQYATGRQERTTFQGCNHNREEADTWTRLVLDGPNKDLDKLNNLIVGVISAARSRVWIMTPYFLPMLDLSGALVAARLRGVEVVVLLPGQNNIKLVHWASRNFLRQLVAEGIDVRYQPPPFIHSKLLLVDHQYALIGSANLDQRSLRLNYELGVELFGERTNRQLARYFDDRARQSRRITSEELSQRPLPIKVRDSLAWLFSPYL